MDDQIGQEHTCVYCGGTKQSRDHVIPRAFLGTQSFDEEHHWLVDCCSICNGLAGSMTCFSIPDKAKYLIKRYKVRYRKALGTPEWTQEELDDVSYKLQQTIFGHMVVKRLITEKLNRLEVVSNKEDDYLMPPFIKSRMKEWWAKYRAMIRALRRKRKV